MRSGRKAKRAFRINDRIRKHGISRQTCFDCRATCGWVDASELKRMKNLEAENAKLKRMYAGLALKNAAIKGVLNRKRHRHAAKR